MGTSTRNTGQSGHNPLIPTWLDDDSVDIHVGQDANIGQMANGFSQPSDIIPQPNIVRKPIPPNADSNRFRGPRTSFTHFVYSGGRDRSSLKRGISRYISRSLGGSSTASQRLGASRTSTAQLYGILNALSRVDGPQQVAGLLSLKTLEGLPAADLFIRLATFICPDGGSEDEGISRSAYYDMIADNPTLMGKTAENLTKEELEFILQKYMSKVVMQHIMNGIANNMIRFSGTLEEIAHIEEVVEQLIEQSVSDAYVQVRQENEEMTSGRAKEITNEIYQKTFEILKRAGD